MILASLMLQRACSDARMASRRHSACASRSHAFSSSPAWTSTRAKGHSPSSPGSWCWRSNPSQVELARTFGLVSWIA
jgi:hypothetical protein